MIALSDHLSRLHVLTPCWPAPGSDDSAGPALGCEAAVRSVRLLLRPAFHLVHAAQLRRPARSPGNRGAGHQGQEMCSCTALMHYLHEIANLPPWCMYGSEVRKVPNICYEFCPNVFSGVILKGRGHEKFCLESVLSIAQFLVYGEIKCREFNPRPGGV